MRSSSWETVALRSTVVLDGLLPKCIEDEAEVKWWKEYVRDIVNGMSDGLTVPFALAAGLSHK